MSSKKDKFNKLDKKFMNLAIELAKTNKGLTGTNPSVGCVVVKKNNIISYGKTNVNGRPHAEAVALTKSKKNYNSSKIYLTLEPCTHYGITPPCTNLIIESKVKNVVYSVDDLDPRTSKKAKKILNSKKIYTKNGLLSKLSKEFYKDYYYIKKNKLPYVTGKLACSSDMNILKNKTFVTNEHSRKVSHLLRYKAQGILTSYKTINSDNPKLSCRLNGLEKYSPIRIIVDKDLKIKTSSYLVNSSKTLKTIIFYNVKNLKKIKILKKKGLKLIYLKIEKDNYFDFYKIFKKIYNLGIHNLLVECGKNLTYKILSQNLFNEFYLFKSNKSLKNNNKINILNISNKLNKIFMNKININTYLDKDILMHYY